MEADKQQRLDMKHEDNTEIQTKEISKGSMKYSSKKSNGGQRYSQKSKENQTEAGFKESS